MALVNPQGNYIKINKENLAQMLSNVRYHTFRDHEARLNPSEFDQAPESNLAVSISADTVNALIMAMYTDMKAMDQFKDCTDA